MSGKPPFVDEKGMAKVPSVVEGIFPPVISGRFDQELVSLCEQLMSVV
jgi:hypothetical protein